VCGNVRRCKVVRGIKLHEIINGVCSNTLWMWKCGQACGKLLQSIVTETFLKFHSWFFVCESDTCFKSVSYMWTLCVSTEKVPDGIVW
jgi:hypothetical protein